ncbi:helix-turn-helix domain-containing protein [Salinicola aestuarinus]|uniref:helix-turn-helix domain-containing protein n=1 Tax=Salinicola aestuarinus TaxID=1949082 RepID=UPI000DA16823|nr:helix-turn-helix transcriptional regulator [Salinicola aestuarinus]
MNGRAYSALGAHLKTLREARGLTLSRLAADAGLAKSSLSRLERGDANPTLDTLWRLARELDVTFSALTAPIAKTTSVDAPLPAATDDVALTLVERGMGAPAVDVYLMHLMPGAVRDAEPHTPGTEESVQLIAGSVSVGSQKTSGTLAPGERLTFDAGQAHRYVAYDDGATLLVTIVYPHRHEEGDS